jgi:membrane protease YdiL (CAAX protease family)
MAIRAYLLNRFAALGQGTRGAWWLSLVIVSVVFGACHHEVQGITGALQAGVDGRLLGLLYLGRRRELAAPIVAHGVSNTVAFVMIYFSHYPGL